MHTEIVLPDSSVGGHQERDNDGKAEAGSTKTAHHDPLASSSSFALARSATISAAARRRQAEECASAHRFMHPMSIGCETIRETDGTRRRVMNAHWLFTDRVVRWLVLVALPMVLLLPAGTAPTARGDPRGER